MTVHAKLLTLARRFGRDTTGNTTLEFITLVPFLMYFIFALGEVGTLMARTVLLDRGLDIAVRNLRLGLIAGVTHDDIKDRICEAAFLLNTCQDDLLLELTPLAQAGGGWISGQVNCIDRTEEIDPVIAFNPGSRSEIMLVRACLVVDPLFPGTGIGALLPTDASGGYAIVVSSAFMNEPG